jgi:hypothetical protein
MFVEWVIRRSIERSCLRPIIARRAARNCDAVQGGNSIMGCACGFTRREVLRAGSLAAAGLLTGARLGAQAKKGLRIDIHAHLWTTDYLDLTQSYGNVDTGTQRNKGAGMG